MSRQSPPGSRHRRRPALHVALFLLAMLRAAIGSADEAAPTAATYVVAGPAFYSIPSYPGASSARTLFVPYLDAQYANRLYSNASDLLGVYAYKTDSTQAGIAALYDLTERRAADDLRLRGLPDVGTTVRLKLFASQTISFVTGDANVATAATGHEGTLIQSNLWLSLPLAKRGLISVGPGLQWADSHYAQTFFTVTPLESLHGPLPAYAARAGCVDFHVNGLAAYNISSRWSVGASEYFGHLRGSAGASPIVVQRSQQTLLAFVSYKIL